MHSEEMPYTPRAKRVLAKALQIAVNDAKDYVGAEHIFHAVLGEGEGPAYTALLVYKKQLQDEFGKGAHQSFGQNIARLSAQKFVDAGCTRDDLVKLGFL